MKPICKPCQRFFRPEKNGFYFIEGMPIGDKVAPGTSQPDKWKPYKLWIGDLWKCQGCGTEIIVGVPAMHISEHYMTDFDERVQAFGAKYQVNDC